MQVIKFTTTRDASIYLTQEQVDKLNAAHVTLRNDLGDPYCNISRGLREGEPTYTDTEIDQIITSRS